MKPAKLIFVIDGDASDLEFLWSYFKASMDERLEEQGDHLDHPSLIEIDHEIVVAGQRPTILD